ncbi:cold-shock protein [Streptomyces sp. ISL-100]|uniref:cold-shock protein n=1 Tax=Streptomyces sp. ISL-100 TaxID=2819173 RepID=UPI001BE6DA0C|nr:cold shock domain-containing protein [Streptomyces sp. ISL-100]MBT2396929.1 cold shock domain-containing protein [Streptomyces sp. ISL-100]
MVTGRVVRFDGARGYGFIAPEGGGEDVFLHANDMLIPEAIVRSGLAVEFELDEGDRGPKASGVRLARGADGEPLTPPVVSAADTDAMCDVLSADECLKEMTEVLLRTAPSLTGEQILAVRAGMVKFAKGHGWIEG